MAKVTFDYGKAANVIAPHEMESMAEIARSEERRVGKEC